MAVPGSPWLPRTYLARPALSAMLDASTQLGVTMLVAPAGAGKTLGVAGWLQQRAAEPTYWLVAGQQGEPGLDQVLSQADGSDLPALVIVDDAHELPPAAVRALDARLAAEPDRLRVLLLARWDLPLSRLVPQLLGHLTVIRGDALRLTDDETSALVRAHVPAAPDDLVDAIRDKAEGWCAAVVLAARASAASPSTPDFVRRFRAPGPGVADLVAGEVFAGLRPRERHLLLCCSAEPLLTTGLAVRLSADPAAGDALAALEQTGLLVSRVVASRSDDGDVDPAGERYAIHPLLREVARRRLVAGGPDAARAQAGVLRETRLDLAQGRVDAALRRFLRLGAYDEAVGVVADHGLRLVCRGRHAELDTFVRAAGAIIEQHPEVWAPIAWNAWATGAQEQAEHWARRVERSAGLPASGVGALQAAAVVLRLTRPGGAGLTAALSDGRAALESAAGSHDPWLAALLLEVGVAESWLGLFTEAEEHLGEAVVQGRSAGLEGLAREAVSHLALTQLMLGHGAACLDLAEEAGVVGDGSAGAVPEVTGRVEVARALVELGTLPFTVPAPATETRQRPSDLTGRFWSRVAAAASALRSGSLPEAERELSFHQPGPRLPRHLHAVLLLARATVGAAAGDRQLLRAVEADLQRLDAPAELAWVQGVIADLSGDVRRAAHLYDLATDGSTAHSDPRLVPTALVCAAQVRATLGDDEGARARLGEALALTRPDRFAWPFLGWSTHGRPVGHLLELLGPADETAWTDELRRACSDRPSIVTEFRSTVATERELETATAPVTAPSLSPREREVLTELARGSTYADIASNLYVSENTVKTHISSLYSKLSVSRRSEALAVGRQLHLI